MRHRESRYVGDVLQLLYDYFCSCGCSDSWLLALAERAVTDLRQRELARRALGLFRSSRPWTGWQAQALSYCEYLLSRDVWNELRGSVEETEELEELPL
jgi:hypothetical protein